MSVEQRVVPPDNLRWYAWFGAKTNAYPLMLHECTSYWLRFRSGEVWFVTDEPASEWSWRHDEDASDITGFAPAPKQLSEAMAGLVEMLLERDHDRV